MTESLEFELVARLREVVRDGSATEGELRAVGEQADGWERVLVGQIHAGERRLRRLNGDPASPLAEIATELRHLDALRSELVELHSLVADLERRSRELRTSWLVHQADSANS